MTKTVLIYDDENANIMAEIFESRIDCLCLPYSDANNLMVDLEAGLRFDLFFNDRAIEAKVIKQSPLDVASQAIINGDDLGRKVRKLYPDIPIITLSGHDDNRPSYSSLFLLKPTTTERLVKEISDFLYRK